MKHITYDELLPGDLCVINEETRYAVGGHLETVGGDVVVSMNIDEFQSAGPLVFLFSNLNHELMKFYFYSYR